ncbi:MAG: hypothetical protein JWO36_2244 [Myxococcales bacterium]|nr:hypothetical protein [Myxococcales bacterium]
MRIVAAFVVIAGTAAGTSRIAHACECIDQESQISPPSGSVVSPYPTLYFFVPTKDDERVRTAAHDDHGHPLEAHDEVVVKSRQGFSVHKIVVAAATGTIVLRWSQWSSWLEARYTIGTSPKHARVIGVRDDSGSWACGQVKKLELELDSSAIAYRLEWSDGATTVLPARDAYRYVDPAAPATILEIGRLPCERTNEDLSKLRTMTLFALYSDGSQERLGAAAAQLGDGGVRLPVELVQPTEPVNPVTPVRHDSLCEEPPPTIQYLSPWWLIPTGGVGSLVTLALVRFLAWRRPRTHVPRA